MHWSESIRKYVEERMVLNDHLNKGHGKKHFKGLCLNVCRIMHICPMEEEIRLREGFYRGVCYDLDNDIGTWFNATILFVNSKQDWAKHREKTVRPLQPWHCIETCFKVTTHQMSEQDRKIVVQNWV